MITLPPRTDPATGEKITIVVDDTTLEQIRLRVADDIAMAALKEGHRRDQEALARGDIASPEPPAEYLRVCEIANTFNPRYAASVGPKIITYLIDTLILDHGRTT